MIDFGFGKVQEQAVKIQLAEPAARDGPDRAARAARQPAPAAEAEDKGGAMSLRQVKELVEKANDAVRHMEGRIRYSVDSRTRQVQVQVMDPSGERVVREIPPKELIELRERLKELAGAIFDAEA